MLHGTTTSPGAEMKVVGLRGIDKVWYTNFGF